jgi:hypothetical protein
LELDSHSYIDYLIFYLLLFCSVGSDGTSSGSTTRPLALPGGGDEADDAEADVRVI